MWQSISHLAQLQRSLLRSSRSQLTSFGLGCSWALPIKAAALRACCAPCLLAMEPLR